MKINVTREILDHQCLEERSEIVADLSKRCADLGYTFEVVNGRFKWQEGGFNRVIHLPRFPRFIDGVLEIRSKDAIFHSDVIGEPLYTDKPSKTDIKRGCYVTGPKKTTQYTFRSEVK